LSFKSWSLLLMVVFDRCLRCANPSLAARGVRSLSRWRPTLGTSGRFKSLSGKLVSGLVVFQADYRCNLGSGAAALPLASCVSSRLGFAVVWFEVELVVWLTGWLGSDGSSLEQRATRNRINHAANTVGRDWREPVLSCGLNFASAPPTIRQSHNNARTTTLERRPSRPGCILPIGYEARETLLLLPLLLVGPDDRNDDLELSERGD
jgi:hypothetical protein